ncbi:MAG: SDR family NAD(P)-dependent oxidoreductase [Polyangiaceae bacterium]
MARVFITGSSDGLGLLSGKILAEQGHAVTLHARNEERAADAKKALPAAEHVVVGDFSSMAGMRAVATQANEIGAYDAVIHNAGIGYSLPRQADTEDGLELVFAVNVLAPYLVTALMKRPSRLVYLSSGLHHGGDPDLTDPQWRDQPYSGMQAYSDSKLFDVVLAFAMARKWRGVCSNAVHPGWVPTKMGGRGAPEDLTLGATTQAWLAVSEEAAARVTGRYFFHKRPADSHPAARDERVQDELLAYCAKLTGREIA